MITSGDDRYVIPSDVQPLIAAKSVDRELFNVSRLVDDGLADAGKPLPVIVDYRSGKEPPNAGTLRARADALPGGKTRRTIAGAGLVSFSVDRRQRGAIWSALAPAKAAAKNGRAVLRGSAQRLLLDRRVSATLEQSVPQIGAPQAWQAGHTGQGVKVAVLDTGLDPGPDFEGTVIGGKSFVGGEAPLTDGRGHGTHVASTVLGQGKAGTPVRKGVAPGAKLLVGKVLNAGGHGLESDIIAGMHWAAEEQDADIINLSLGAPERQETDLLAQTVDDLSATTGALFVVAAGNEGAAARTLDSPGIAASALTVGAVDKADKLTDFSSRGPRQTDGGVKPEISAPGHQIVATLAEGTSMGSPVDANYTSASGTSMATPHVAGAAAILKQQHPTWSSAQIKAALVGSAKDIGRTAFETGSGRVQVDKAIKQTVLATPDTLSLGRLTAGQGQVTKTVSYTNTGSSPVTLALKAELKDSKGNVVPSDKVTLSPSTLTIAAGQTGQTQLTVRRPDDYSGIFQGRLTATAGDQQIATAIGLDGPVHNVTFRVINRSGNTLWDKPLTVLPLDDPDAGWTEYEEANRTLQLPQGSYQFAIEGSLGEAGTAGGGTLLAVRPEVNVTSATEVVFDARQMKPIQVNTGNPTVPEATSMSWNRWADSRRGFSVSWIGRHLTQMPVYVMPTSAPVTKGTFAIGFQGQWIKPPVLLEYGGLRIGGRYHDFHREIEVPGSWSKLEMFAAGKRDINLVYVGDGSAAQLPAVTLDNKVALVQRPGNGEPGAAVAQRLKDAGYQGAIVFESRDGYEATNEQEDQLMKGGEKLPVAGITRANGLSLLQAAALDVGEHVQLSLTSTIRPDEVWNPAKYWKNQIPADPRISMDESNSASRAVLFPSTEPDLHAETNAAMATYLFGNSFVENSNYWAPVRRREFFPADPDLQWARILLPYEGVSHGWVRWDKYPVPSAGIEMRGRAPFRLGQLERVNRPASGFGSSPTPLFLGRRGNTLYLAPELVAGEWHSEQGGRYGGISGVQPPSDNVVDTLTREGTALQPRTDDGLHAYDVPAGDARYSLRLVYKAPMSRFTDYEVDTTWGFNSRTPSAATVPSGYVCGMRGTSGSGDCAATPLLLLDYGISHDMAYTVAANSAVEVTVFGHHQPGIANSGLTQVQASVSYDAGATWQAASASPRTDGGYAIALNTPNLPGAKVSLRVQARDADGNTVDQTLKKVVTLRR
ncbi:S8 family serine peptidase [Actinomadura fulvescens]